MTSSSSLHQELKKLIVDSLQLEDIEAASIGDAEPLFGGRLELDSIDALELVTTIARTYDVGLTQDQETRDAFRSVNELAAFITRHRDS